ncbi:hypothetical protein E0K83_14000 [Gramella sp. BOM4]|nr:hypothetical protein [Christiangramia bathymodioli]
MKKKNVLVTGIGQVNYILQLYSQIISELPEYRFNSLNLRSFGNIDKEKAKGTFFENFDFDFDFSNLVETIRSILSISFDNYFQKHLRVLFSENGFRFISRVIPAFKEHIKAYQIAKFIDCKTDTDVIHLHFPKQEYALFINYLNRKYQIIFTYWGSDIFRINNRMDHEIQAHLLPTSTLITVATPEMKFALITRYGSGFEDKIRIARFIHDWTFYELAHDFMQDLQWKESYLNINNFPGDKKIILFGHNAFRENNHLKFLESLQSIPPEIIKYYHIIFSLTYPSDLEYIEKVKSIAGEIPTTFSYLTDFMSWEDMVKLKIVSDIYIHAPTTDGLSAFLTEFLYTNNLALVGSWLPYKTFLKYKIKYLEFDDFEELSKILQNLNSYSVNTTLNKDNIEHNFNSSVIADEWLKVFNELPK